MKQVLDEDRETSYFVFFFCFIFVIKPGNCLHIVSAFVCRTTSGHVNKNRSDKIG